MQNNRKSVISGQPSHHLDRMAKPYIIWLYILAVIPMLIMVCLMFVDTEGVRFDGMEFAGFSNFSILFEKSVLTAFWNSIYYSILTTAICIFFGYIIAYNLFKSKIKNKYLVLLLLILPMWTNILLRINALGDSFKGSNVLTSIMNQIIGAITNNPDYNKVHGWEIMGTDIAILLGMVFTYLPFIVLPIYTSLEKIDPSLEEAATDLGMTETKKFWKVIVPLSAKGCVSGSIMVALPCLSGFAIPAILGQNTQNLIGNIIEQSFKNMSYNQGSVLALVILIIILGSIILVNKFDKEGETLL